MLPLLTSSHSSNCKENCQRQIIVNHLSPLECKSLCSDLPAMQLIVCFHSIRSIFRNIVPPPQKPSTMRPYLCSQAVVPGVNQVATSNASDSRTLAAISLDAAPAGEASSPALPCHACIYEPTEMSEVLASLSNQRSLARLHLTLPLGDACPTSST